MTTTAITRDVLPATTTVNEDHTSVLVAVSIDGTMFQIDASGPLEEQVMESRALETCEAIVPPETMGLYVWEGVVDIDGEYDELMIFDGAFRPLTHQELVRLHQTGTVFSEVE